jgi:hypothetical protein
MQLIIDEIVNNIRSVEKSSGLSHEQFRQVVSACLDAVRDMHAKDARVKEEQSIDGPWSMQPHGER